MKRRALLKMIGAGSLSVLPFELEAKNMPPAQAEAYTLQKMREFWERKRVEKLYKAIKDFHKNNETAWVVWSIVGCDTIKNKHYKPNDIFNERGYTQKINHDMRFGQPIHRSYGHSDTKGAAWIESTPKEVDEFIMRGCEHWCGWGTTQRVGLSDRAGNPYKGNITWVVGKTHPKAKWTT